MLYTLLVGIISLSLVSAQKRYLDPVFEEVKLTSDVTYASNISIEPIILGESETPELVELKMDIYEPMGDSESSRPVVIMAHAGDFLPPFVNQSPYGNKADFAVAETCRQLAKRGYVAISIQYRLGFNPFGPEIELKSGVLQASYRLTQDLRTAVRFIRKTAAEDGNPYGVNPDWVAVGGFDSAGWGAAHCGYLKSTDQINNLVKFVDLSQSPPVPFVPESVFGDPYGVKAGDLNVPNHVDYSSEVAVTINIEGGVGDISWIEAGDPPTILFQREWVFPRGIRDVTLGATGSIIIPDGAFPDTIAFTAQTLGNQDVFENGFEGDPTFFQTDQMTTDNRTKTGDLKGLMLYRGYTVDSTILCDPTPGASENNYGNNSYPWNAYDAALFTQIWNSIPNQTVPADLFMCQYNASEGNVNDAAQSAIFIDSMINYMAPRLVATFPLNLQVNNDLKPVLNFSAYPNPAHSALNLSASEGIKQVVISDLQGRTVFQQNNMNQSLLQVNTSEWSKGIYVAKVYFEKGVVSEKILVQ